MRWRGNIYIAQRHTHSEKKIEIQYNLSKESRRVATKINYTFHLLSLLASSTSLALAIEQKKKCHFSYLVLCYWLFVPERANTRIHLYTFKPNWDLKFVQNVPSIPLYIYIYIYSCNIFYFMMMTMLMIANRGDGILYEWKFVAEKRKYIENSAKCATAMPPGSQYSIVDVPPCIEENQKKVNHGLSSLCVALYIHFSLFILRCTHTLLSRSLPPFFSFHRISVYLLFTESTLYVFALHVYISSI